MAKRTNPLSARQKRFIAEYLKDCNGGKAAIRAGYSEVSARVQAVKLLKRNDVKALVSKGLAKQVKRTEVKADQVIAELALVAFSKIEKTSDKLKALELLGKHLSLFTEKREVTMTGESPIRILLPDNGRGGSNGNRKSKPTS